MPTYLYRREDGSTFEIEQRITEPAFEMCPTTGQKVTRLISGGAGLIFKGSGFYLTDYVRKNSDNSDTTSKTVDSASETTKESKKESKSETAKPDKPKTTKE